jgi:ribosome-associated protein
VFHAFLWRSVCITDPQAVFIMIRATKGITIDHRQVQERFVHAQGPGGRNLHKEATAVELRLDLNPLSLPLDVLDRLIVLAGKGVTNDGVLVVVSRAHISQAQNRKAARERLAALLESAFTPPKRRKPTKPRTRQRLDRVASKRLRSAVKTARRSGPSED